MTYVYNDTVIRLIQDAHIADDGKHYEAQGRDAIVIDWAGDYNQRRYSKPWIAKVDFTESPQGDFTFGDWLDGDMGKLVITASAGDVIAYGQKDSRKPGRSVRNYIIVQDDGSLSAVMDKAQAYESWLNKAR